MPTSPSTTYSSHVLVPALEGEDAPERVYNYAPSDFYPAGLAMAEITATPGTISTYATGNTDGTGVWGGLLNKYDVATDADGNITFGLAATGGPHGETHLGAPCYYAGTFRTQDLSGVDTDAVADAKARIIEGDLTHGLIRLG